MRRVIAPALLFAALATTFSPAKAVGAGWVGYIGCSQAIGAVDGYHLVGGTKFWPTIPEYGGGTVLAWDQGIGTTKAYWAAFKNQLKLRPPSKIWIQWCTKADDNPALLQTAATRVVTEVHRLAPGVPVYVSAQNGYGFPHACPKSGQFGPLQMELLARRTAALPGPDVGDLRSRYQTPSLIPGDQTQSDGCHPNLAGRTQVLGPRLKAFFG